jgi:hypothetical protein
MPLAEVWNRSMVTDLDLATLIERFTTVQASLHLF